MDDDTGNLYKDLPLGYNKGDNIVWDLSLGCNNGICIYDLPLGRNNDIV